MGTSEEAGRTRVWKVVQEGPVQEKEGEHLSKGGVLGRGALRGEHDFCSKVPNWWPTGQILLRFACSRIKSVREFPGDPVVRTRHFHYWCQGSIRGQGTKFSHDAWCGQKKKFKSV